MAQILDKVNLERIKKTISHIYRDINIIEIRLNSIERKGNILPEEQFRKKYPRSKTRKELFDLVGILPNIQIREDKREVALAIERKIG